MSALLLCLSAMAGVGAMLEADTWELANRRLDTDINHLETNHQ